METEAGFRRGLYAIAASPPAVTGGHALVAPPCRGVGGGGSSGGYSMTRPLSVIVVVAFRLVPEWTLIDSK
jgi:hypothetical protein